MVSDRSTPKSGTGTSARLRDNLTLDIPPLPLAASDVASSNRLHSMNLPGLSALDPTVARSVAFNENDIIIAYVFL